MKDDRLLRALTGLNRKAFEELKRVFQQELEKEDVPGINQKRRKRAKGGGRKPRLKTVESKLIYILFYFKCYPTFDLAGILFGLDRSQANRWMHRLQKVLERTLGVKMALPKRHLNTEAEFNESFPEVNRVILDGTERPIQRSSDREKQKQDYSGKKKRHTRNHLGAVAPDKRILILSKAYHGKNHDKGILNREQWVKFIPDGVKIQGDLGFLGLQNKFVNIEIPHKKPKGGELSAQQKEENLELARERVVCEHAFAGVKRYNIAANVYRNRIKEFDDHSMFIAAGLWNFYLMAT